jgi:hypothetical protein
MIILGKSKAMFFVFLFCSGVMIVPFIASCGKGGEISAAGSKIQFQVVNASPDLQPIDLYVELFKQNLTSSYSYPLPSGYFSLSNILPPIQIKSASTLNATKVWVTIDSVMKPNYKYTLFVTGLKADSSVTGLFVTDNAPAPTAGRGKIRFVNASPHSTPLDITANDSLAFINQAYKNVSPFIEIPPGNYIFRVLPTGKNTVISTMPTTTIADGKVYTLYCYGISGGADSVAFNTGIISNR